MITAVYAAARVIVMMCGWLVALMLGLAADALLTGAKWPIFIGIGAWWTLVYSLLIRHEVERIRVSPAGDGLSQQ